MMIEFLFALLCLMLVASNVFWLYHYNKLLNKFMSRNYHDFVAAEGIKHEFETPQKKEDTEVLVDPYDRQRARELNQMTGMV